MWMLLVLFYGIIKGIREICKKKALENNSVIEVLMAYSIMSLLILLPTVPAVGGLEANQYLGIAFKSFVLFIAWMVGFKAIKQLPISMYGVLDLSRVLFATFLGIVVLKEEPTLNKTLGAVFVCAGLLFLKFNPLTIIQRKDNTDASAKTRSVDFSKGSTAWFVILALISCALNAVSGLMDKILMSSMNSSQLQFWYTLFLTVYYLIYVLVTRTKISKTIWTNGWVWLLAILLIVMDRALFIANANPASQVTIMTLIKQVGVIVTIIAGKLVFKEKGIVHKLVCAGIIIVGILLGVM